MKGIQHRDLLVGVYQLYVPNSMIYSFPKARENDGLFYISLSSCPSQSPRPPDINGNKRRVMIAPPRRFGFPVFFVCEEIEGSKKEKVTF